jgi:hypothetical protein
MTLVFYNLYRVQQANFLFHMAFHIQKRRLACRTLYYIMLTFKFVQFYPSMHMKWRQIKEEGEEVYVKAFDAMFIFMN